MSESLFYNRDQNISGLTVPSELAGVGLTPVYGSRVTFEATNHKYNTDDFYYNLIPMSVNSLTARFDLKYDVNESGARDLAAFFESKEGFKSLEFAPDSSVIYKSLSGFCDNYAINFINNQHFEVAASINVDRAPTLLNWKNGNFANVPFQAWLPARSHKKYDVVYYRFNPDGTENENKLENFYYCSGDHIAAESNSPTGINSLWTQKFFFEPDIGVQNDVPIKADVLKYENSFIEHLKTNDNISTFGIDYTYTDITDHQLKCMLHFLERKGGYRRFEHQIPSVYNRPKVYYSPTWTHTWNYSNSNTLSVNLIEDPLGVIPKAYEGIDPWDNTGANAYISAVESNPIDPYVFYDSQKGAITDFLNELDSKNLSSKIKKMWLVGFSVSGGLYDVMNPTVVESYMQTGVTGWVGAAPDAADLHNGYATFDDGERLNTLHKMSDLGITHTNCGAFFAGTNMSSRNGQMVNAYTDTNQNLQLKQANGETVVRFGFNTNVTGAPEKRNGVWVGSRNVQDVSLTRIKALGVSETVVATKAGGSTPTATIDLWGHLTTGDVSAVGVTAGLTSAETITLGGLLYDLCVGVGHTGLETQDS